MTEILTVDSSRAADVLAVIHEAFANRPPLDPPATALDETLESISEALDAHGGLLVEHEGRPVGALLLEPRGRLLGLRRVGVLDSVRGLGVAAQMATRAETIATARKFGGLEIEARVELPRTVEFWRRLGYVESGRNGNRLNMLKMLPITRVLRTAEDTRAFGEWLATLLRHGDLVILTGDLGAGKTTLTQGIGQGLGVRGNVTSPTFVISRVHPSLDDGPPLIHVDAYRLGGAAELDDLDLDTDVIDAVTVVEWGEGLAEALAIDRLELSLTRSDDDVRTLELRPVGPRWRELLI
ncbi:tRNA (adenosine(37)-N6)-threonylcarbamoyltransferase complex ATPase subunit type 1 TsaE [Marmoricola sp. URHB0036]|uniref:tRNA (adenosine(37)-N6)-threonylcarbamoyltransferase complex ATPase subunit type 1 TsaE n=1 Tax=Marmoricola sp. URHB0036 TaxID=1298863 RepID=UPI0004271E81|nr:tRNA (adenosine(37)-N6)-threonylcarbamoyltransferase complex ATPase subunit type 1 TsaE [Marmoricola sp. URHB0036]